MKARHEPGLKEYNVENAGFFFAAYAVIWAVVFCYVFLLVKRQSDLKRRLEELEKNSKL
jgi:CcmD family protein